MKKLFIGVIILIMSNICNSCTMKNTSPEIVTSSVARSIDPDTCEPTEIDNKFSPDEVVIYFVVNVKNLPENTKLNASWKYLNDGTETNNILYTGGSGYQVFKLKSTDKNFLPGIYEVTVTGVAGEIDLKTNSSFEILQDTPAVNITTPITSRSVDDEKHLSPIEITSEFTGQEKQIYFTLQSSSLPENSTVKCIWQHMDTGISISSKVTAEGSKNIAFYLKCKDGIFLPEGSYTVTASTILDNRVQSVKKVFEVK